MDKHITILEFIKKLKSSTNIDKIEFLNNWDGDLCALGLRKEEKVIYINSFNYISNKEPMFDFDLEIYSDFENDEYIVVKEGRGVSTDQLIYEIKLFF